MIVASVGHDDEARTKRNLLGYGYRLVDRVWKKLTVVLVFEKP